MRRYLPSLAELIDRLSIVQQKEILEKLHKEEFTKELEDIVSDISTFECKSEIIRHIVVLTLVNSWIWTNEDSVRRSQKKKKWKKLGKKLMKTHMLNDIRSEAKRKIQEISNGRIDYKLNNIKADNSLKPSGY